jgi:hypothetical protein
MKWQIPQETEGVGPASLLRMNRYDCTMGSKLTGGCHDRRAVKQHQRARRKGNDEQGPSLETLDQRWAHWPGLQVIVQIRQEHSETMKVESTGNGVPVGSCVAGRT